MAETLAKVQTLHPITVIGFAETGMGLGFRQSAVTILLQLQT
jgi:hypothetical protein